jgi:hypothetical protein
LLEDVSFTDKQVTNLKGKLDDAVKALEDGEFKNELVALSEHLEKMHKELVATSPHRISGQIRLAEKIGDIYSGIINYSGKPTDSQIDRLILLEDEFNKYRTEVDIILIDQLPTINKKLKEAGRDEITVITREDYDKS